MPDCGKFDPNQMLAHFCKNPPYGNVLKREKLYSRLDGWTRMADLKKMSAYGIQAGHVLHFQSKRAGQ